MNVDQGIDARAGELLSVFPIARRRRALVDLCVAFAIGFLLLLLNLVVNFGDRVHSFFGDAYHSAGSVVLLNVLFFWLACLLWVAFARWRAANRKAVEFDAILASISPDTLLVVNRSRDILLCNGSVNRMFGYDMGDMVGKKTDFLYADRRTSGASTHEIYDALRNDGFHVGFADGLHRDGHIVPVEIISAEIKGGGGAVLLLRDISERVKVEKERREMEARLRQRQKLESIGVLAGGIAHDFNNLMMVVLGNLELATMSVDAGSPARKNLEDVKRAAERASELCGEMLAYSGKGKFLISALNLSKIVREMGGFLDVTTSKKIECVYDLDPELPDIHGDAAQIRQIVINLMTNASDAIGDDEGRICVTTAVRAYEGRELETCCWGERPAPGRYVVLTVQDSGCGMSQETLERMFDPFFSTKLKGRGLGLASVQGIIRGHKGAMMVQSRPGEGTMFSVLLPVSDAYVAEEPAVPVDQNWTGSGLVLVADDEEELLTLSGRMLTLLGFKVLEARDGMECVERFKKNRNDIVCVMLDLTMPKKSGEEVFREIRALAPRVPILLTSGYTELPGMFFQGDSQADFVQKPYQLSHLRSKLRALMGKENDGTNSDR